MTTTRNPSEAPAEPDREQLLEQVRDRGRRRFLGHQAVRLAAAVVAVVLAVLLAHAHPAAAHRTARQHHQLTPVVMVGLVVAGALLLLVEAVLARRRRLPRNALFYGLSTRQQWIVLRDLRRGDPNPDRTLRAVEEEVARHSGGRSTTVAATGLGALSVALGVLGVLQPGHPADQVAFPVMGAVGLALCVLLVLAGRGAPRFLARLDHTGA